MLKFHRARRIFYSGSIVKFSFCNWFLYLYFNFCHSTRDSCFLVSYFFIQYLKRVWISYKYFRRKTAIMKSGYIFFSRHFSFGKCKKGIFLSYKNLPAQTIVWSTILLRYTFCMSNSQALIYWLLVAFLSLVYAKDFIYPYSWKYAPGRIWKTRLISGNRNFEQNRFYIKFRAWESIINP